MRAPNADLDRDPRWGRSEESYGEDSYLDGTMVTAFVKGLQGMIPSIGRLRRCSSTSWPTAMKTAVADHPQTSTSA